MTDPEPVVLIHHGTTRVRAERIIATGPDPNYVEPGGDRYTGADAFSTVVAGAPDRGLRRPERYARDKSANFPNEGGPVILEIEVPEWIVDLVRNHPEQGLTAASGEIRFEPPGRLRPPGVGLNELLAAWPNLTKRVIPL